MRTRFAPSPTGPLHVGGARTALFNYLLARSNDGSFLVRFEDTNEDACTDAARDNILNTLDWLGLDWDAGPDTDPMYAQSNRSDRYRAVLDRLIDSGAVYPCYCTEDRLDRMRDRQRDRGDAPRYDGRCRDLDPADAPDRDPVYRFRAPDDSLDFDDAIKGSVTVDGSDLADFVVARSDGSVTYNLAVVVDDHDMDVTHVLRGDDHLSNVPKQALLYDALGWDAPVWAHLPLVHGADGKLSSSDDANGTLALRDDGYLPAGVNNWLARMGWSPDGDDALRKIVDLADRFALGDLKTGSASVDYDKLDYFNREALKGFDDAALAGRVRPFMDDIPDRDYLNLPTIVGLLRSYCDTLADFRTEYGRYFVAPDAEDMASLHSLKGAFRSIKALIDTLGDVRFDEDGVTAAIKRAHDRAAVEGRPFYKALYLALSGHGSGPPYAEYLPALGKDRTLRRLRHGRSLSSST